MKRLILCTAGHVDHGKTALVRALTGIDCDTHPEERRRGITINPGFAFLDLPPGEEGLGAGAQGTLRVGIVDVPGHHRFIRNMLAGACGVDAALLVVACDDGVMPQTREHLALMELLGVQEGLVALTKVDLASPDLVDLAREDVRAALAGSFLDKAEIVPVSSTTGKGLPALRSAIGRMAGRTRERPVEGMFRMPIDRVFSVAGFGTVVTGSIMGGQARREDMLLVLPGHTEVKVRRIERYGEEVQVASAGERASFNLSGFERSQFERGMLLADQPLVATSRIDVQLKVLGDRVELGVRTQAIFFAGTQETACHVRLLGGTPACAGHSAMAQIELEQPAVLVAGDRFVLRSASADLTLGGGQCVDVAPLHHRRPSPALVEQIRRRASGDLAGAIVAETDKRMSFVGVPELAAALRAEPADVKQAAASLSGSEGVLVLQGAGDPVLLGRAARGRMVKEVLAIVAQYHREDPLGSRGVTARQVAAKLDRGSGSRAEAMAGLLDRLVGDGVLRRTEAAGYVLPDFVPKGGSTLSDAARHVLRRLIDSGMNVPPLVELEQEIATRFHLGAKDLKAILKHLVDEGELVAADDGYLVCALVARCQRQLLEYLAGHPEGITLAQFRDLIGGSRKIGLMLLGHYDRDGVTLRQGDLRRITDKGRALVGRPTPK